MKPVVYLFLSVLIPLLFIGCDSVVPEVPPTPIVVDAVSSASTDIRIDSGVAYDTFAILYTYHKDSYDDVWIGYGLTPDSGDVEYDAKKQIPVFPKEQICTLRALTPETEYFFYFSAGAPATYETEHHGVAGSFTTTRLTDVY